MNEITQMVALQRAVGHNPDPCECHQAETIDAIIERQDDFDQALTKQTVAHEHFSKRIDDHMHYEDQFKGEILKRFDSGDERMNNIEAQITGLNRLADAFDGFQKTLKVAGIIGAALVGTLLWIFAEKNGDIKAQQEVLIEHTATLRTMVASHQELERDYRRDFDRLQREIDRKHGKSMP